MIHFSLEQMSLIAQILQKYKAPAGCSNMAGVLSAFLMTNTNMDWIINTGTSDHSKRLVVLYGH